ncbi:SseB family protein [Nocardioides sp. R-C-SC26]|uniref:SseB family protein n=1 Tax=Nocardioides sp. R-C-SC26 TaxID=2870414 RepID=UPI001E36699F|nr:SseB family protein [Nocardioides sp. R-C-SC26]
MTRRDLLAPAFPDDTGEIDPALESALAAYAAAPTDIDGFGAVLDALGRSRVLVPVMAVLGEVEYDEQGLAHDKSSDMAAVLLEGADGRLALLGFTSTEALSAWRPDARPVPVTAVTAALAAVQEKAAALVLDVGGPVPFVVEGEHLRGLAAGWQVARVAGGLAWVGTAIGQDGES